MNHIFLLKTKLFTGYKSRKSLNIKMVKYCLNYTTGLGLGTNGTLDLGMMRQVVFYHCATVPDLEINPYMVKTLQQTIDFLLGTHAQRIILK